MRKIDSPPPGFEAMEGARVFDYGHLELAAAFCRRLGLKELVDRLVPTRMELSPGLVVQAMVLDTLSGRSPLYRLESFLAGKDAELLLGEDVPAEAFNDTNVSRSLDAVFNAGTSNVFLEIGAKATLEFSLDPSTVSYDTTSTSVWGDYFLCEGDDPAEGPAVTHGHSKDKRPDLKQFMTELLCVERGVPIFGAVLDGNSSDKTTNNKLLTRIGSIMKRHGIGIGAFVYVADSAMATQKNLEAVGDNLFITRLPAASRTGLWWCIRTIMTKGRERNSKSSSPHPERSWSPPSKRQAMSIIAKQTPSKRPEEPKNKPVVSIA